MEHYGLIGNPVSHSLSEKYFTDKFMLENIDARFERFLLNDIQALPQILETYPHLKGLSVTSPFKTAVIAYCTDLDETAKKVRAVNTLKIKRTGSKLIIKGYNTDVDGFAAALLPFLGNKKPDALLLGSGGAARAVAYAMQRLGINFKVVSRSPGEGKITYRELNAKVISTHKLIVNATPLGMGRYMDQYPDIPYQHLSPDHLLFDLIYNPAETRFMAKGRRQKAKVENGLVMLQAQAERAWEKWKD
ncbi:MAG: shikimate dehydrogenase [Bacteroidales bacterium]|nr:shikimate dehydrogenase [Bacteroidales bacterium]